AAYYLDLAEAADPGLRTARQGQWMRKLVAEQDNMHAALRWMITRRDGDGALRFVRALAWYSPDPWLRAAVPLQRGSFYAMLGRLAEAESDIRAALAGFRAIGDPWGRAATLVQLADFAAMRAEYPAAIGLLEEAASLGAEVGAWGDVVHIAGKLAAVRLRAGDLAGARADLERAEQGEDHHGSVPGDAAIWLGLARAELHVREGDPGAAARQCEMVLSYLEAGGRCGGRGSARSPRPGRVRSRLPARPRARACGRARARGRRGGTCFALGPAPVGPDGEEGEDHEDGERPQQRPDRRGGDGAAGQQAAFGLGEVGDRGEHHAQHQDPRQG
ncbi:MAG TPA: hypothetical protein VFQ68_06680, partial [Streptosporangiaceae bacterium]|nr:hypothetical protein [Streptosporangiaceae bacterium]